MGGHGNVVQAGGDTPGNDGNTAIVNGDGLTANATNGDDQTVIVPPPPF